MRDSLTVKQLPVWQFAKFCVVGLVNTLAGYSTILVTGFALGLNPYAANVCGYAVGLTVSFALNRRFTFASQQAVLPGLAKFLTAFLPSYGLNLVVLHFSLNPLQLPEYLAQALAMGSYSVTFFILCRLFVFRMPRSGGETDRLEKKDAMPQNGRVTRLGKKETR